MIKLRDVKYDKKVGIVTAIATYLGVDYNLTINPKECVAICDDGTAPDVVLGKCAYKYYKMISLREKILSEDVIVWF